MAARTDTNSGSHRLPARDITLPSNRRLIICSKKNIQAASRSNSVSCIKATGGYAIRVPAATTAAHNMVNALATISTSPNGRPRTVATNSRVSTA